MKKSAFLLLITSAILGSIFLVNISIFCAQEQWKEPESMEYYDARKDYARPRLENGIIQQRPNTWVKRSPLSGGPPSPRLGYEASMDYDNKDKILIRHGGHNQGGGGTQGFETWTYDLAQGAWTLMYPNTSPPGNCCSRTNVFDQANGVFIRFPGFSGHHGWQWSRRITNMESSVWVYDPGENKWANMRPFPEISVGPARSAAYDTDNQVVLVFNVHEPSKTAAYDFYTNTWTLLYPENEPPGKPFYTPGFNMSYDQARKVFVLFGIGDGTDPRTLVFDIKQNKWKDARPGATPPYYKADPVMAYDSDNKVTICVAANTKTGLLETWAYDAGQNTWEKMGPSREPDPSGERNRMVAYSPDQGLVILENRYKPGRWRINEQQIWTYRYADAPVKNAFRPPADLTLKIAGNNIELAWAAVAGADGYNIYHGTGPKPWLVGYEKITFAKAPGFVHNDPEEGAIHYYYVTAVSRGKESAPSFKVRSQPRVITDVVVFPLSENKVEIQWKAEDKEITGYNIYRAETNFATRASNIVKYEGKSTIENNLEIISGFSLVNKEILKETKYSDDILPGKIYSYRVCAVNALGIESGPSPYVLTIPSPPEYVFSKEDGDDCRLKWRANPEKSVVGYNIYRTGTDKFDDRHDLLNKEPVKATEFTDKDATKGMPARPSNTGRRYYITAVDFLGQESFPSAPVWFYREWRKFYKIGVWHQ